MIHSDPTGLMLSAHHRALIRFFPSMEFTFIYFELFNTLMYADYESLRLISQHPIMSLRNRKYRVAMDTVGTAIL